MDKAELALAHAVREARKRAGLTQAALGQLVGLHLQTIHAYETGKFSISEARLNQIAEALGIPPAELLNSARQIFRQSADSSPKEPTQDGGESLRTDSGLAYFDTIGERLRAARIAVGLTPEELAERAGIPVERVTKWESNQGWRDDITFDHAAREAELTHIAGALRLPFGWLSWGGTRETVGWLAKELRTLRRLSLSDAATQVGVSPSDLRRIEAVDYRGTLPMSLIERLALSYGVNPQWMLEVVAEMRAPILYTKNGLSEVAFSTSAHDPSLRNDFRSAGSTARLIETQRRNEGIALEELLTATGVARSDYEAFLGGKYTLDPIEVARVCTELGLDAYPLIELYILEQEAVAGLTPVIGPSRARGLPQRSFGKSTTDRQTPPAIPASSVAQVYEHLTRIAEYGAPIDAVRSLQRGLLENAELLTAAAGLELGPTPSESAGAALAAMTYGLVSAFDQEYSSWEQRDTDEVGPSDTTDDHDEDTTVDEDTR